MLAPTQRDLSVSQCSKWQKQQLVHDRKHCVLNLTFGDRVLAIQQIGRTVGEIETLGLFSGLLEHFIECVDDIDQNSPQ